MTQHCLCTCIGCNGRTSSHHLEASWNVLQNCIFCHRQVLILFWAYFVWEWLTIFKRFHGDWMTRIPPKNDWLSKLFCWSVRAPTQIVRTLMKSSYFWQTLFFRETRSIFRVKIVLPCRRLPWRWLACRRWSWRHLALKSLRRRPPAWRSSPLSSPWMGLSRRTTFHGLDFKLKWWKKYQAILCKIPLVVKTYNLLRQHYLSIRAKPISDIIVDVFGNIIHLSGKNYIVFGTH